MVIVENLTRSRKDWNGIRIYLPKDKFEKKFHELKTRTGIMRDSQLVAYLLEVEEFSTTHSDLGDSQEKIIKQISEFRKNCSGVIEEFLRNLSLINPRIHSSILKSLQAEGLFKDGNHKNFL